MAGPSLLSLEELHAQVLVLCEEQMVLRECLAKKGVVTGEHFCARLHRRRFDAMRIAHPNTIGASPLEDFAASGALHTVACFAGLPSALALDRASSSFRGRTIGSVARDFREHLFICGGSDGVAALSSVDRYNPANNSWRPAPSMLEARLSPAAAVCSGCLYVCGGSGSRPESALSSAERFDPLVGTWEAIPNMAARRQAACAGAVSGYLYIVGGEDAGVELASVECFNPNFMCWEEMPRLHQARHSASSAVVMGHFCVCGGTSSGQALRSAEYLDGHPLSSRTMPPLQSARSRPMSAVVDSYLYVFGGWRPETGEILSSLERFDHVVGAWETLSLDLTMRSGGAAGIIDGRVFLCGGSDGQAVLGLRSMQQLTFAERRSETNLDALFNEPETDGVEELQPMPSLRHLFASAVFTMPPSGSYDSGCFLTASI